MAGSNFGWYANSLLSCQKKVIIFSGASVFDFWAFSCFVFSSFHLREGPSNGNAVFTASTELKLTLGSDKKRMCMNVRNLRGPICGFGKYGLPILTETCLV